ncbi:MAG: hypothetical protein KJ061_03900 [Vicinamibacteraceae bacterium]|nr:hypothetical protein [Vicinamibacteraceae bacterium]
MTRRRLLAALALAWVTAASAASSGCGYALAGRGSFLPDYIQTIGIPTLGNRTPVFEVEQQLTQRIRTEFIGRGRYKVIPETTGADAVLTGEITTIALNPSAFNDQQIATRYQIIVVLSVKFEDVRANKVLWENPTLVFRDEFDVSTGATALDAQAFFGTGSNATERVSTEFAKTVVSSILEAF